MTASACYKQGLTVVITGGYNTPCRSPHLKRKKVGSSMKKLSVVIPVFNQVQFTKRCLPSVIDGATTPHQLIIIDNNSQDETADYLRNFKQYAESLNWQMQIITNPKNVGVGAAFNQGIKLSTGDYIALGNNDTWWMKGWDKALVEAAEKLNADMIGSYYNEDQPFDENQMTKKASEFVKKNKGKFLQDWGVVLMMFKRTTFEKVGVFDERFFVCYEDRDLRERMDRAGLKYYVTADCFIWHHSKGTRDSNVLPSGYEAESLKKFIDKWSFDPRIQENKKLYKYKRKFRNFKRKFGYF